MKDWIAENWPYVLAAILYVAERSHAISKDGADKIRGLVRLIRGKDLGVVSPTLSGTKTAMEDLGLLHDTEIDAELDNINPEPTPRVSKGKKVWRGLLKLLPLISRVVK